MMSEAMSLEIVKANAWDVESGLMECLNALTGEEMSADEVVSSLSRINSYKDRMVFAARTDGRCVGTATLVVDPHIIHGGGLSARVEDVAVHPDYQGKGIGAKIVSKMTSIARDSGCYKITLTCREDVIGFYEKLGFKLEQNNMRMNLEKERSQ